MENIIATVTSFAAQAHQGQVRRYSKEPYINHPIRVMQICFNYEKKLPVVVAALLHDVLEDTAVTEQQLQSFLQGTLSADDASHTMNLVVALTDVYTKEAYPLMNKVQRKMNEHARLQHIHADAQTIKYADIIDNSIDKAVPENENAERLLKDYQHLLSKIPSGNAALYELAKETVGDSMLILDSKNAHAPTS